MFLGKILSTLFNGGAKQEDGPAKEKDVPVERRDQSPIGQGKRANFDLTDRMFKEQWDRRRDDNLREIDRAVNNPTREASAFSLQRRGEQLKQEVERAHRLRSDRDMRGAEDQVYIFKTQGR